MLDVSFEITVKINSYTYVYVCVYIYIYICLYVSNVHKFRTPGCRGDYVV